MNRTIEHAIGALAMMALAICGLTETLEAQRTASRRGAPPAAAAKDDRMLGLMLGVTSVAAPGISITGEDMGRPFSTSFGTGFGVMAAYGFTPRYSAFAALDVARQPSGIADIEGEFGLVHFEIGARANFPMGNPKTVPYVSASVGNRAVGARVVDYEWDEEYDLSFSGRLLALGGGVQHFFSPKTALDVGVSMGFGAFNHLNADGEQSDMAVNGSTTIRLRVGVTWRP